MRSRTSPWTWAFVGLVLAAGCSSSTVTDVDGAASDASACDLVCDDGLYCNGVERCDPSAATADAHGCVAGAAPCAAACSETTRACVAACPDDDHDGAARADCGGTDCDDTSAAVHPGAEEVCDPGDVDEDCDGATFGVRDADHDTYADARCCNVAGTTRACGDDCDDASAGVHPALAEVCDGRDNDCDEATDEGTLPTWHTDADGDGFGGDGPTQQQCLSPGAGWAAVGGDCDDTLDDVHPGLPEACNGRDDNCRDGVADEAGCACISGTTEACGVTMGACRAGTRTCIAGSWGECGGTYVAASSEVCSAARPGPSGVDEDCDGAIDETVAVSGCYPDVDADGYGEGGAVWACAGTGGACPAGMVSRGGDCGGASSYPGAAELCDSADNDCDAASDEGLHVRRVGIDPTVAGCQVWEYGRDLVCEQRLSAACGTRPLESYCAINTGFYISSGGLVTIGCAQAAYYRSDIMRWELTARHAGCDGSSGEYNGCQAAAHRYCPVFGYLTGYATRTGVDTYSLTCFSSSQVAMVGVSWAELDARDGAPEHYCGGPTRDGWWCARAVDQYCRDSGYATGFGPVEYNASGTTVACLRAY